MLAFNWVPLLETLASIGWFVGIGLTAWLAGTIFIERSERAAYIAAAAAVFLYVSISALIVAIIAGVTS
jgi:hypothetical protein